MPLYTAAQLKIIADQTQNSADTIYNGYMPILYAAAQKGEYTAAFPEVPNNEVAVSVKNMFVENGYTVSNETGVVGVYETVSWQTT